VALAQEDWVLLPVVEAAVPGQAANLLRGRCLSGRIAAAIGPAVLMAAVPASLSQDLSEVWARRADKHLVVVPALSLPASALEMPAEVWEQPVPTFPSATEVGTHPQVV